MKNFIKILLIYTLIAAIFGVAVWSFFAQNNDNENIAKVEAIRAEREFRETGTVEISKYSHIKIEITDDEKMLIISYENSSANYDASIAIFAGMYLLFLIFLIYIYVEIVMPFKRLSELPFELAKGNLTIPLKERKSKYFGKFIWGLDNLRETLEKAKEAEHSAQKKNQTQILEISHDIMTPLSAVRLYAEGLRRGVYSGADIPKTAESIIEKTSDIERFVSRITKTASDEFMDIDFHMSSFMISEIIDTVKEFYNDKLKNLGIKLNVEKFHDVKVIGDRDRVTEALFNVCENAVKYGGGEYIKISSALEEDCLLIKIENDGNTLDVSEIDKIFECFRRGTNTKNRPGSGLGLYITRKIMRMSDGEAYAEIKDGTFTVTFVLRINS
jgi:signal transduction histidine kinase